ncbi:MAG: ABC transporter ATP-binding protein [Clostridiaceae bacterium]|nr:ABC transporter ATP-binding protein/permease [Eubacteriales bacterium]
MSTLQEQDFDQYSKKIDLGIWKRLFKYALHYKGVFVKLLAVLLVVALVDIAYPLMSRYAIDNFVEKRTMEGIGPFIAVYVCIIAVQTLSIAGFIRYAGKLEMNVAFDIRQQAFKKLQELSFSFYDKTAVGYLMARMVSDISRLSEMIAWSVVDVFWAIAYVVGVMITLFTLNFKLALLVLVVIPPLVAISIVFQRLILKYQRVVRKTNSRITGSFNEGIMGAMTSKTLVREKANTEEFVALTGEMRHASIKAVTLSAIFMPIVMFLGSIGTGLALERGGYEVMFLGLSFGTLSAFISYTMNFFEPIQQLAGILAEMQSAQASAERVITLIDTPCEIVDSDEVIEKYGDNFHPKRENWEEIKGDIEFEHVSFSYKEGETVLSDFSLKVRVGETIALVGETGSGKSTIVNLVCRFYEPTEGRILVDGRDYKERSQLWLQDRLGYVLQTPHLFSGTIRENILYGRKDATDEDVCAAARMVSAEEFILRLENGYDTEVGEGGARLSTGEKQLISFARVILADPKIFVLDEATSSIDTETEQLIQNAITHVLKDRTSFIVAHRLSTIRNADRILVIDGGKIAEMGTHKELIKRRGHYYDLYTTQFREEASDEILR